MALSPIEKALQVGKYVLEFRQERIDRMNRKPTLSAKEKDFIGEEEQLLGMLKTLTEAYHNGLDIELGKLPPQATDMEEAVLGAVIIEGNDTFNEEGKLKALAAYKKLSFLLPQHFYLEAHQMIWEAIRCLILAGGSVDMRTVVMQLRKLGTIDAVGGAYKIAELTSKVSSASNVEYHSRLIVEMAVKRRMIEMAGMIMAEGHKDTKDCFEMVEYAEQEFKIAREWLNK